MAVALRSSTLTPVNATATTGLTCTAPGTIVNGDTLVLMLNVYNTVSGNLPTPTPPTGFTAFTTSPALPVFLNNAGDGAKGYLWYKVASSESGNYSVTWSSTANTQAAGWVGSYSGTDPVSPVTVTGTSAVIGQGTAGGATWSTTGLTTTVDSSMVAFFGWDWADNSNAYSAPAATPPTFATALSTTLNNLYVAEGVLTTAGATGSPVTTANESQASSPNGCALVVINAPSASADLNVNLIN